MNYPKMNFHTHTTYCDGKESVESMIQAALQKGFVRLGFSGHAFNDFRPQDQNIWCMSLERTAQYVAEVRKMAEKYQNEIEILCGIEQDYCAGVSTAGYDYVIGSVHYVEKDGIYYCVDESPAALETAIREGFGGDPYALTKRFFEMEANVVRKTNASCIGHFDLVTKFNEGNRFFDPMDLRYRRAALTALDALAETGKPLELNTGGVYRGFRTEAYPSAQLLKDWRERGGDVILSSDSHDGASLGFRFAEAAQLLKELGYSSVKTIGKTGFDTYKL